MAPGITSRQVMRALGSNEDDREQRHHREGKQVGDPFSRAASSRPSSRLAFSSAKAVVALKINTKIEISAAIQPPPDSCALASTVWMTSAPRSPVGRAAA